MLLLVPAIVPPSTPPAAPPPSLQISPGHAVRGQTVNVIGSGFTPGYRGSLLFDGHATGQGAVTDRHGRFIARFAVPGAASFGLHLIALSGQPPGSARRPAREPTTAILSVLRTPVRGLPRIGSGAPVRSPRPAAVPPASPMPTAAPRATAAAEGSPNSAPGSPPAPTVSAPAAPPSPQPSPSMTPPPVPDDWREDFTTGLGSFRPFIHAWSNGQRVEASNVSVVGGTLRLRADFPPQVGGMVVGPTFDHGYFEARIRCPLGTGLSPAFWLRRPETAVTPWDEVDIMEAYPNTNGAWPGPNRFQATAHTYPGGAHSSKQVTVDAGVALTAGWHTFGARLIPGQRLDVYLDGILRGSITQGVPTRQDFEIVFSHIAGNWSAQPDGTTPNQAYMEVDWVRWTP